MRALVTLVAVCSITYIAIPAFAAPPMFRMEPLPELAGLESAARCGLELENGGLDVAGCSKGANGVERAVKWHKAGRDCTATPPMALPTLDVSRPSWVNDLIRPADTDCTAIYLCGRSITPAGVAKPVFWYCPGGALPCTLFVLPTLPSGIGEAHAVTGLVSVNPIQVMVAGASRNAANTPKAVVWEQDENGAWQVEALPHPTMASEGAALDIIAPDESTTVVAGFAENADSQTRPQVWKRVGAGPWARTELPLLAGGAEGHVLGVGGDIIGSARGSISPSGAGWSDAATGNRMAVLWTQPTPGQLSVTSLGTLAGRMQSELQSGGCPDNDGATGTSYNTSPEVDGLATLWDTSGPSPIAYNVNALVVGDRSLEAFVVTSSFTNDYDEACPFWGNGRSLSTSKVESSSGMPQHALLLIEDNVTAVTPPGSGFTTSLSTSPNPFDRSTSVSFSLVRPAHAVLSVYDVQGRRVATLAEGSFAAGRHDVHWPARDALGDRVGPGVYVLRLEAGGAVTSQKVVQIR